MLSCICVCCRPAGATFEELCHNYTQERLQLLFNDKTITAIKERLVASRSVGQRASELLYKFFLLKHVFSEN
jgi:hypothetical protein